MQNRRAHSEEGVREISVADGGFIILKNHSGYIASRAPRPELAYIHVVPCRESPLHTPFPGSTP